MSSLLLSERFAVAEFQVATPETTKKNPSECHFGSLLAETGKESHCCKKAGNGLPMLGSTS